MGLWLFFAAIIGLWLAATPIVADSLVGALERQYAAITADTTPSADAIVILGGASAASGSAQYQNG